MKQLRAAARAAIYVKVGHPHFSFEQVWFGRFLAETPRMRIVDGSRGAAHRSGDPHLWTSPAVMRVMAIHVAGALAETMPEHAAEFSDRLRVVQAEIDTLDAEIRSMLAPCRGRVFLVFHPAWGYFADDYGLIQESIEQDGKSPAPADLARTIEDSRAAGVRSVFIQPQTSASSAQTVAAEIGANVVTLDPLSRDWPANMRLAARAFREALCDD
jgi:zinc transport system substrate-binding protein